MPSPAAAVPAHLRRFVVQQDPSQYTAADQAVWRFVLLQMRGRLVETAHPAYRDGLAATGISVERIPGIDEMNDKLARVGWSAVCVDGFIPPRAFQELQASAILPIAADVRSRAHLAYTPAPDIIHEAAGHAPILPDPVFASYLRRMGDLGKKAFTLPEEARVFDAIHTLSEVKEDPAASAHALAAAEAELRLALASATEPSEAALLSRLYWWTAEYGLVGRPDDYKLYGAGLLSSLGESHSCHDPAVRKLVLDERCVDVAYDITRPQPQLFVAPSFEALHDVLDRVARTLASAMGGEAALSRALRSGEVASIHFSSGASVIGVLRGAGPRLEAPAYLRIDGPVAFAWDGEIVPALEPFSALDEQCVLTGRLEGGASLEVATDSALASHFDAASGRYAFRFNRGAAVDGRLVRTVRHADGRLMLLELVGARLTLPGAPPRELARYLLLAGGDVVTAHAGAVDARYYPDTPFSPVRVPRPRAFPAGERAMIDLYERAEGAHRAGSSAMAREFPRVHAALQRDFPREWLLRWNMLESLRKAPATGTLAQTLWDELEHLEMALDRRQPIASGLRYLESSLTPSARPAARAAPPSERRRVASPRRTPGRHARKH
jgi:phenylalanine-4-hydroxylase